MDAASHYQVPILAQQLMLSYPNARICILGGFALWQYVQGDWVPGDVDIFICGVPPPTACSFSHSTHMPSYSAESFQNKLQRELNRTAYRYIQDGSSSKMPASTPLQSMGKYCRRNSTGKDTGLLYDVMTTELTPQELLDQHFDLDVCAIGYEVVPWNMERQVEGLKAFFMSMIRLDVHFQKELRTMITSWVLESTPVPDVKGIWIKGKQFNEVAAYRKPNTHAVFQWKRSGYPEDMLQGQRRVYKYQSRGYTIVEYPSRALDPVFNVLVQDAIEMRALRIYKRRKKAEKRRVLDDIKKGFN